MNLSKIYNMSIPALKRFKAFLQEHIRLKEIDYLKTPEGYKALVRHTEKHLPSTLAFICGVKINNGRLGYDGDRGEELFYDEQYIYNLLKNDDAAADVISELEDMYPNEWAYMFIQTKGEKNYQEGISLGEEELEYLDDWRYETVYEVRGGFSFVAQMFEDIIKTDLQGTIDAFYKSIRDHRNHMEEYFDKATGNNVVNE